MHKPKHSHTRGEWASQLPRRCTRWLIDLGCGMGMAPEVLLRERHPRDWTFKSDAAPTAEAEGAAWVASQRALRFAGALAAGFVVDGLCIAGLDGNAFFVEPLRKRTLEFAARGHPAIFIVPSVISAADGNATFLLDTKTSSKNFWGSSLFKNRWNRRKHMESHTVPSYSLKTILRRLGVSADDDVLMHVNAEGGEFLAIPPAIADGSLCRLVDHLTIDLHYTYFRGAKARTVFTREQFAAWVNSSSACPHMKSVTVW